MERLNPAQKQKPREVLNGFFPMAEHVAATLAGRLPELELHARKLVFDIRNGIHGIKNAGHGDLFWQHRPLASGEAMGAVDWRRSARTDDLYIREYERVSPQHYWIWIDLSASMSYKSEAIYDTKLERAIIVGLALAEIAAAQGDFVGIPGIRELIRGHNVTYRLANSLKDSILSGHDFNPSLIPPHDGSLVILSDFWQPADALVKRFKLLSSFQTGNLVRILDPLEPKFDFKNSVEFIDNESEGRIFLDSPQDFKSTYENKFQDHEIQLKKVAAGLGWPITTHLTNTPALSLLADILTTNNGER